MELRKLRLLPDPLILVGPTYTWLDIRHILRTYHYLYIRVLILEIPLPIILLSSTTTTITLRLCVLDMHHLQRLPIEDWFKQQVCIVYWTYYIHLERLPTYTNIKKGPDARAFRSNYPPILPTGTGIQEGRSFHGMAWNCIAWLVLCFFAYMERPLLFCSQDRLDSRQRLLQIGHEDYMHTEYGQEMAVLHYTGLDWTRLDKVGIWKGERTRNECFCGQWFPITRYC